LQSALNDRKPQSTKIREPFPYQTFAVQQWLAAFDRWYFVKLPEQVQKFPLRIRFNLPH
jgi:hypothetical protein